VTVPYLGDALIPRRFGAILVDPPWRFATWSDKGKGRSPEAHYDCMSLEQIKALPVASFAAVHSCKTVAFNWLKVTRNGKEHVGLGYWTRANCELCLLGTRGYPKRQAKNVRQTVVELRREHSRKPASVRERIEKLVPGPYLELFARERAPGWATAYSPEVGLFDQGSVETRRIPSDPTKEELPT
jgi:N6-adenosine-specific RNA methylase IME4